MKLKNTDVKKMLVLGLVATVLAVAIVLISKMRLAPEGAALLGVLFGSAGSGVVTWYTKKTEERKHFRELVVNSAIENWKAGIKIAADRGDATVGPLDSFLIHSRNLFDLVLDKN